MSKNIIFGLRTVSSDGFQVLQKVRNAVASEMTISFSRLNCFAELLSRKPFS